MNSMRFVVCCLMTVLLFGCAATQPKTSVSEQQSPPEPKKELVEVVCKAAYRQGCRHMGHIYPWNAWLDISGYDSADYHLVEIKRSGNQATVYLEKLKSD